MNDVVQLIDELPAGELRFLWIAGRPSLDLVATVGERWRRSFERLRTPDDLARWIGESGWIASSTSVTPAQLEAARELREAINRLARPGRQPRRGDRALVNRWAAAPRLAPQLTPDHAARFVPIGDPIDAVLATVAADAVDLLAGPLAHRIRECAAPDCALLFVDASRPGRRHWCTSTGCGNRVRTRSYRDRRKDRS